LRADRRDPSATEVRGNTRGSESLTRLTGRGFIWSFGGGLGQALMGVLSIVVLSRLLTPSEFGAAAAAALVVGLATAITQVGLGPALVQRSSLRDEEVFAAFVCSLAMSLALAVLLFLAAPTLNRLVGLPSESMLLRLLCLSLLLSGVAAVSRGLLQRALRFRAMTTVDLLAAGPGAFGVCVVLAVLGFGAFALVWGSIASSFITAVGYGYLARPSLKATGPVAVWRNVRPLLRFGAPYSVLKLGNWFALNADNLVTANLLGPAALGIYVRAYRLLSEPANLIGGAADKVLFPALAKVRNDEQRLRGAYLRATSLVAMVAGPLSMLFVVLAPELVHVLMGSRWSEVVLPLQILAVVLVPRASYKISGSLTNATGAVIGGAWRQWLYAAEVLVACAIGARWGLTGVAAGASVAIVLHFLVMLRFSGRISKGLMAAVLKMYLRKHVPLSLAVLFTTYGAAVIIRSLDLPLATLLLAGSVGTLTALGLVALRRASFSEELGVIRTVLRRRTAAGASAGFGAEPLGARVP
jgi:O-antigen/teichoic acid export membrane protein